MIKEEIINILSENSISKIYYTGCFDEDDKDFIINGNCLYFQLGEKFICFEAIESYSKLDITTTSSIIYRNDIEDLIDGKVEISNFIFENSLLDSKKVKEISFYNLTEKENSIETDVLAIKFYNDDFMFLDPGFLSIKIGGLKQKKFWEENSKYEVTTNIEKIKI